MKLGFIFSHGWAFNKSYWDNLLPYFKEYQCIVLDHGYYELEHLPHIDEKTNWIGVGHSLGLIKLLQQGNKFKALVGLQAFNYFLTHNRKLNRIRSLELAMMKKNFASNPRNTIQSFNEIIYNRRLNCIGSLEFAMMKKNLASNPGNAIQSFNEIISNNIDFYRMMNDLNLLSQNYESLFDKFSDIPALILYTTDDKVVPAEIIEENFKNYPNAQMKKMPNSKHLLGFLNSEQVAVSIKEFLKCF
ncbi:MAG: alpha/beta hydrolase [Candidatus Midichloria sp.]|nr:MAG: alpha/beta hydrolase [Candidatus Midichloria sp.]